MDLRLPRSGGKGSASSACSSSPAAALATMTSSLTLEAASVPVAPVPVASAPVASAPVAPAPVSSATEASELLDSNSFLSMAINHAVKDLGYSESVNTDLLLQDPFRPPAMTTSGSIPYNSGLTPLQYATVLPKSHYQIQVNPDGSHQVVASVQDQSGQSRGMTSAPDGSISSGSLIHGATSDDKTIEDKADQGKADQSKADQGKADQGKADQGKADQGKANEGKANEGNFNESKAGKGKTDDGRDVADDKGTQMNEVSEMFVEPKEGN